MEEPISESVQEEDIFEIFTDDDGYVTNYKITENNREKLPDFTYYNVMNCYKYIDNEFIFDEAKYAKVQEEEKKSRERFDISVEIENLKKELYNTDYKVIKCYEAQLAGEDLPYNIVEIHSERNRLRARINELEALL